MSDYERDVLIPRLWAETTSLRRKNDEKYGAIENLNGELRMALDKLAFYYELGELNAALYSIHINLMLGSHQFHVWESIEVAEQRLAKMRNLLGQRKPLEPPREAARISERAKHSKG